MWEDVRISRESGGVGVGGGVTPAVNGGAGEKTRPRCSGDVEGRLYWPFPSLERTQILFCNHFTHTLKTTTLFSPSTPPPLTNGPRAAPFFWCRSRFIYRCLFMCVFMRDTY